MRELKASTKALKLIYTRSLELVFFRAGGVYKKETAWESLGRALDDINLAKEVAEGLRVLVDFYTGPLLLYAGEREQFQRMMEGSKFEDYFFSQDPNHPTGSSEAPTASPLPPVVFTRYES